MKSIYQLALGDQFNQLHPQLQRKFGLHSQSKCKIVCQGKMKRIWGGQFYMSPFFRLSTRQHITFPERGENIPFMLENAAYVDPFGREAVAWIRRFCFPKATRHFDATMVYSEQKNKILDYVGTKQGWITEIDMSVLDNGGIRMTTGDQKLFFPLIHRFVPIPFLGKGEIEEYYEDSSNQFVIKVKVKHPLFGVMLAYEGQYSAEFISVTPDQLPGYMFPKRYRSERKETEKL